MPALPYLKSVVGRQLLVAIIIFTLSTLTLTQTAFAADPPNPKPCEDALSTDQYTKVVIEPSEFTLTATGNDGEVVNLSHTFDIQVDFSKLSAIFAASNSNYLESDFQSDSHRSVNTIGQNSQDFNAIHGPAQKIAPQALIDDAKKNYVQYVYDKPGLPEASAQYTDLEGNNPKKIYDLVNELGQPEPPANTDGTWENGWGKYWDKIPTAVNEYYYGRLKFPEVVGNKELQQVQNGFCPPNPPRSVYFVMPGYFRTTSLANQLNQIMVPAAAQSSSADFVQTNLFAKAANTTKTAFADLANTCLSIFPDGTFKDSIKKAIKVSLEFLTPIKDAYAANPGGNNTKPPISGFVDPCPAPIPILPNEKQGVGPFCSLPANDPVDGTPQLQPGENCTNVQSSQKEDAGTLVKCNFKVSFTSQRPINGPGNTWDGCNPAPSGKIQCSLTVRVFPTFYVPWLANIWNNSTYSDKDDQKAVLNNTQTTGKPGLYTFFMPQGIDASIYEDGKNLPSKEQQSSDQIKQRFLGATKNGQVFDKDCALMPVALREYLNIDTCNNLQTSP